MFTDLHSEVTCVNEEDLTERLVYSPTGELAEFASSFSFVVCFGMGGGWCPFVWIFVLFCFGPVQKPT